MPTTVRAWSLPARTPRRDPIAGPAVDVNAWGVYTNTSPAGSYRAFGASHLQWAGEAQIDEIGRKCGLDGVQMRELNLLEPGEYVRPGGKPLDADLKGDIRKCADNLDWDSPKPPNVGRGVSVGLLAAGAHPVSTAFARMEADGKVVLYVSSTDMGQGARTVFSQIVAEELALTVDQVRVMGGDTQVTPYDRSTGASRSTTLAGMAVHALRGGTARAAFRYRQPAIRVAAGSAGDARRRDLARGRIAHLPRSDQGAFRHGRRRADRPGRGAAGARQRLLRRRAGVLGGLHRRHRAGSRSRHRQDHPAAKPPAWPMSARRSTRSRSKPRRWAV